MADVSASVTRHAVRVLLLDEANRVLLVRFWDGHRSWWCTPGGAIEPAETELAAAARELREELGEAAIEIGPCIWTRRHVGVFRGRPFDQSERITWDACRPSHPGRRLRHCANMGSRTSGGGRSMSWRARRRSSHLVACRIS